MATSSLIKVFQSSSSKSPAWKSKNFSSQTFTKLKSNALAIWNSSKVRSSGSVIDFTKALAGFSPSRSRLFWYMRSLTCQCSSRASCSVFWFSSIATNTKPARTPTLARIESDRPSSSDFILTSVTGVLLDLRECISVPWIYSVLSYVLH